MAAVVRVKRRIDEEPLGAFIINCKKPKLNEQNSESLLASKDEVSTIVKFAGTLESQDEEATLQVAKLTKDEAKELVSKVHKHPNALDRNRQQMRERAHENRFKVVNCYRAIESSQSAGDSKEVTIVDVEKQTSESLVSSSQEGASVEATQTSSTSSTASTSDPSGVSQNGQPHNYVYDLYLADEADQYVENANLADNYLSVRPFENLVYEDYNDDYYDEYDSEDSNQENYFKNDYPDTEEEDDMTVENMRQAMEDADLDDLSSDDEENCRNGFVYSIDSDAIGFEDDIDYCDVNRYGETYARYRGRSKRRPEAIYNDNESDYSDYRNSDDDE